MSKSNWYFPSDYEEFIYKSRYARWNGERREEWPETVDRYLGFMTAQLKTNHDYDIAPDILAELRSAILNFEVVPSMRALMTADETYGSGALSRDNTAGYNCAYLAVDDAKAFDEAMFILLCGTGVGFSVEDRYTRKLPIVPDKLSPSETTIVVADSKEGWAKSLRQLIALLYSGEIPQWDVSKIRPAGARLKTFGGRASGPEPLVDLFNFAVKIFSRAEGRRLTSLECHDLMTFIARVIVVGGVRRSAMISLSDLGCDRMRHAKSGMWYEEEPQRALANNSAVYDEKPDIETFMREWLSLVESKSGERGIFNRQAAIKQVESTGRRENGYEWGTNPCSEILLRGPKVNEGDKNNHSGGVTGTGGQFCNLSEVIVREGDTLKKLKRKGELATLLGTYQSTLTHFPYLRKVWKKNTEEERLLGVSLTGIMDHSTLSDETKCGKWLSEMKAAGEVINDTVANDIGVQRSASIFCVKPSGTVSQLVNSASGIHTRHNPQYIRTVRGDKKDPLTQFLIDNGIPNEDCQQQPLSTTVFSFPHKAPEGSICRNDMTAIEQLRLWLVYQTEWCHHKPSVTISVKDAEWLEVGAWVYKNFDAISGISFLPFSDHVYPQAPYQDCSEAEYTEALSKMPDKIDWSKLSSYEDTDNTVSAQTLACTGTACEIVDISN